MNDTRTTKLPGAHKVGGPRPKIRRLKFKYLPLKKLLFLSIVFSFISGWWVIQNSKLDNNVLAINSHIIEFSRDLGFKVKEVLVRGRAQTGRDALLDVLQISRDMPILSVDLNKALDRVIELPWVRAATIERMLPDTILVNIEERDPLAIWQNNGNLSLIDTHGEVILKENLVSYSSLLLVVGEGAAEHAYDLIQILSMQPDMMQFVKAATWVGGRRWNLHLEQKIDVRLPESNPKSAWKRLAQYNKSHGILGRKVEILDLRIPGRLIVRKTSEDERDIKENSKKQET